MITPSITLAQKPIPLKVRFRAISINLMATHRLYFRIREPTDHGSELYPEDFGQLLDHQIREETPIYFHPHSNSHDTCGQQSLYDQFGNYLVQNGLYMDSQLSTDSFAGELGNQTNLAVKVCLFLDEQPSRPPDLLSRSHLF